MVGIYKITNRETGQCYVGQSIHIKKRWRDHFCKGATHSREFQDAIDKHGKDGFVFQIIERCPADKLLERERFWISELKPEYNTVTMGHPVSAETRELIREKLTGRKQPPELIQKRRKALRERYKRIPKTNAEHRKRVAIWGDKVIEFESVKACAEYLGVSPSTVTHALKRKGKVRKLSVWYVV